MNKNQMIKAQGKVSYKVNTELRAALVLDLTSLYTERTPWGKATRYFKSVQTACKQDRLGCVNTGWLVMVVSAFGYTKDIRERLAKAEEFITNFTGSIADVLNEDGTVNRDVVPADVNVILVNNRNLAERKAETADGPIRTRDAGDGVKVVEDARLVVRVAVAEGVTYPWLRADNAAKAYAKQFGNGAKLVRRSVAGGVFVYNWAV